MPVWDRSQDWLGYNPGFFLRFILKSHHWRRNLNFLNRSAGQCHRSLALISVIGTLELISGPVGAQPATNGTCSPARLRAEMAGIAQATQGPVGAAVLIVEGGSVVALHGEQHLPMQSVYKLPIGMAVLHRVDLGMLRLDQRVRIGANDLAPPSRYSPIADKYPNGTQMTVSELLDAMMGLSDCTASDVLLKLVGGPGRVTAYLRGLGVQNIVVATSEKAMAQNEQVQYRNWATPDAMVSLLRALQQGKGLSASSRRRLLGLMAVSKTGPHRIKGMLPVGTVVAHKTGASGTVGGLTRATNDAGLVTLPDGRHLAIAVFVSDTKADAATRDAVIAKIARAAWDCRIGLRGSGR